MRRLTLIVITAVAMASGAAFAADLPIPPLATPKPLTAPQANPKESPVQQNQPNCSRWTDECVTCTRGAPGSGPTCSNIGFACQPKAIRCIGTDVPQSEPRK